MHPADIAWWGWLLMALVAALLGALGNSKATNNPTGGFTAGAVAFLFGVVATVSGLIGVLRFVKWVWEW